jgi:hypothetical protein
VQDELAQRKGIEAKHVIVTSDEKDTEWWQDVANLGWFRLNHTKMVQGHGRW